MKNYKTLKAAGKVSVRKQDVNGVEELQIVKKMFSPDTGEAQDDSVKTYTLSEVKREIDHCKEDVVKIEAEQADWEELEKDLKAL
tara:strand:+ start:1093 stop:1347 length:255 start_codon:yes stop_codon:yes gene_type:complete